MVQTRHSLSSLSNVQQSAPSPIISDQTSSAFNNTSKFDIGRSDEENDQFRKRSRVTTSRPLYDILSDAENCPPVTSSSVKSRRSAPPCNPDTRYPKRSRTHRGQQMFSLEPFKRFDSRSEQFVKSEEITLRHSEPREEEPESKKPKFEEQEDVTQDESETIIGRTRQQTRQLNSQCVFSGCATETCDEEETVANSTETDGRENEFDDKPTYNLRAERKAPEFFRPSNAKSKKSTNVHVPSYFAATLSSRLRENSKARRHSKKKRKAKFHNSDSDSSSSSSSGDERSFRRRKKRSMRRSRMSLLPMNLNICDLTQTQRDRKAIGASLADVDPMNIDKSTTFASIGGLDKHIRSLKEMVLLPFLYPELFSKFNINPPRGCLFYGPPGTGKTLMARALANECSKDSGRKISFFMRKGADCLSKWVGESERQLRLLFDQAYIMRPSIIFFDEIDGLAPVRSSRQDQIHSSIVSTLLALMDGLDNRGEIIVIGATNRIDSIDPALRRPGRFDREFLFKMPDVNARLEVVKIATKAWNPPMSNELMQLVAEKTHGYSGADINLLCMESALISARRTYPQIYVSSSKLEIDITSVNVEIVDVFNAMRSIKVSTTRVTDCPAKPLSNSLSLLLGNELGRMCAKISAVFYHERNSCNKPDPISELDAVLDGLILPENAKDSKFEPLANLVEPSSKAIVCIWYNDGDNIVDTCLLPAVLNEYEDMQIFMMTHSVLFGAAGLTPEEAVVAMLKEAARSQSAVICIPNTVSFYGEVSPAIRLIITEFIARLKSLPGNFLVLLTLPSSYYNYEESISVFEIDMNKSAHVISGTPTRECYRAYFGEIFNDLIRNCTFKKTSLKPVEKFKKVVLKPNAGPASLNEREINRIREKHIALMRELRIYLRDVLIRLARSPEHRCFLKPVDREEVADYYDVIKQPMDLTTMMSKTDSGQYVSIIQFLEDIDLIADNALEYNPVSDPQSLRVRHRACAFRDSALSMVKMEIDSEFEEQCAESLRSFSSLGLKPQTKAPKFFFTRPPQPHQSSSNHNFPMKLRSKQGDLVDPLTIQPKAKPPVANRNRNDVSRDIVKKYKKQQQQAFVHSLKSSQTESPFKSRISPIKPRITRSKSKQSDEMMVTPATGNRRQSSGEDLNESEQQSQISSKDQERTLVYADKMFSPDNEMEQSKLLVDSSLEPLLTEQTLPFDNEEIVNRSSTSLDLGKVTESIVSNNETTQKEENERLFTDVILNETESENTEVPPSENQEGNEEIPNECAEGHSDELKNSVNEDVENHDTAVENSNMSQNAIDVSREASPEIGLPNVQVDAAEMERKRSDLRAKLDTLNNALLEVAVQKAFDFARISDVIEMHSQLRRIIFKHKWDESDEKAEMYEELKNYLEISDLEL
ncbi:ATPase family AAA domain-containing protein 2-like [Convolutriloba macropyga]|uniref:ATPase family AAA domain-containing protein 2-like n=1 Tax=Convolutriloba macropyga TaxID=536237 RepID=UPI003F51C2C1